MTLKKRALQYEELSFDFTQFSGFAQQKLRERRTTIKRKDNIQATTGVLVVDLKGRMVSLNQRFILMWNLSEETVSLQNDWQAIKLVSSQFENPACFLIEARKIYEQVELKIHDLIKLKDGRIFERITKPQWSNGVIVGRIWKFRQID
jgi:PAS domain-containing protein